MRKCWETLSKKETVWIIIVVVLGLGSAAFAFAAQATRVKAEDISQLLAEEGVCHHPFSPAVAFALISALTLLVAHITLNAVGGCICCARGPNGLVLPHSPTRSIAILCFIFSWIAFLNAFVSLLAGAILNSPSENNTPPNEYGGCNVVGSLVFVTDGLLVIATIVFGVNYYVLSSYLRKTAWENTLPQHIQEGIVMGQPAYGAQNYAFQQQGIPPQPYSFQPSPQGTQYANGQCSGTSYPIYGPETLTK
jgi:hypothetical protein